MKAFDVSNVQAGIEIRGIQLSRNIAIDLANKKLCDSSFQEAKIWPRCKKYLDGKKQILDEIQP